MTTPISASTTNRRTALGELSTNVPVAVAAPKSTQKNNTMMKNQQSLFTPRATPGGTNKKRPRSPLLLGIENYGGEVDESPVRKRSAAAGTGSPCGKKRRRDLEDCGGGKEQELSSQEMSAPAPSSSPTIATTSTTTADAAARLRLRLRMAMYKVRTNQTGTPFTELLKKEAAVVPSPKVKDISPRLLPEEDEAEDEEGSQSAPTVQVEDSQREDEEEDSAPGMPSSPPRFNIVVDENNVEERCVGGQQRVQNVLPTPRKSPGPDGIVYESDGEEEGSYGSAL